MLLYIMLFAALSNAICLCNIYFLSLTFANAFCFHAVSWVIDTVCLLKYYFVSCTVLLMCLFS